MRTSKHLASLLLTLAVMVGCTRDPLSRGLDPTPIASAATVHVQLGAAFRLASGEYAAIDGGNLLVGFREVEEDSRCPSDVACVWQGDAAVVVGIATDSEAWEWRTLHTGVEPRELVAGEYVVRLEGIEPAPHTSRPIAAQDYRATLAVRRG